MEHLPPQIRGTVPQDDPTLAFPSQYFPRYHKRCSSYLSQNTEKKTTRFRTWGIPWNAGTPQRLLLRASGRECPVHPPASMGQLCQFLNTLVSSCTCFKESLNTLVSSCTCFVHTSQGKSNPCPRDGYLHLHAHANTHA